MPLINGQFTRHFPFSLKKYPSHYHQVFEYVSIKIATLSSKALFSTFSSSRSFSTLFILAVNVSTLLSRRKHWIWGHLEAEYGGWQRYCSSTYFLQVRDLISIYDKIKHKGQEHRWSHALVGFVPHNQQWSVAHNEAGRNRQKLHHIGDLIRLEDCEQTVLVQVQGRSCRLDSRLKYFARYHERERSLFP